MNGCRPDLDNLMTSDVMTGHDIFEEGETPAQKSDSTNECCEVPVRGIMV